MRGITFEPLIPTALWMALAALVVGCFAWYAWRRPAIFSRGRWALVITLAACGIAAVLIVLLNPTWLEPVTPPKGKPVLTILVDRSASMAVADAQNDQTRFKVAQQNAQALIDRLSREFDIRLNVFAAEASPAKLDELLNLAPDGKVTDIGSALRSTLQTDVPQGHAVMVLSDGVHNASSGATSLVPAARAAKAMDVPVFAVAIGGETVLRDLELVANRPQELAFVQQAVPITAVVRQRGRLTDQVQVQLLHDDEVISEQSVAVPENGTSAVRFEVSQPKSGLYRYELRTISPPRETSSANNSATIVLRVIEEPIRVLLLEGKPYWDSKFLVRTLAMDPSLELDAVVRLADDRFIKRTLRLASQNTDSQTLPAADGETARTETTTVIENSRAVVEHQSMGDYQVIVLGRDAEVFLTTEWLDSLRQWIAEDGGSLVCYRGAPVAQLNQQFSRLLPVRWTPASESRFRVQLTSRGRDLQWFVPGENQSDTLGQLPSLATAAAPEQPKALAVVLAQAEGDAGPPVLTYQPYGAGRVVAIEGSGMWRWAFLSPEYQQHEQVYAGLWQSLMRWLVSSAGLAPGQNAALRTDRVSFTTDEAVTATLLLREETAGAAEIPRVELRSLDTDEVKTFAPAAMGDELGAYQIVFGSLPEGRYSANLEGQADQPNPATTAVFDVRPFSGEQLDVAARADLLQWLCSETGGALLKENSAAEVAKQFKTHLAESRPTQARAITAWDRWWVLAFIALCWGSAWGIRRSGGLI